MVAGSRSRPQAGAGLLGGRLALTARQRGGALPLKWTAPPPSPEQLEGGAPLQVGLPGL